MNDKLENDMLWVNSVDDPVHCRKCGEAMRKPDKPNGILLKNGTFSREPGPPLGAMTAG